MSKLLLWLIFAILIAYGNTADLPTDQKLIVVMLDGCRWDYFTRNPELSGFQKIKESGVVADYVQPILPSSSFESWTTISTGLFSENHQILGNTIYDRDSGESFELHDDIATENPKWWQGHTPIWTSLTHQGFNVSLFHWSKCNVEFKIGEEIFMPKYCEQYNNNNTHTDTVETFETALNASFENITKNEIDVAFVYYPNIDNLGHKFGPDSDQMKSEIKNIDGVFDRLLSKIEAENMTETINFIVVADHGMTKNSNFDHEKLTSHLTQRSIDSIDLIVDMVWIAVKNHAGDEIDLVYNDLKNWTDMKVYKREEIPDFYHIKNATYALDLLILPNINNVSLSTVDNDHPYLYLPPLLGDESDESDAYQTKGGQHGYEDMTEDYENEGNFPDVRTIFMAIGPAFKANHNHTWIKLVDEYQVMMHALCANATANNGTWSRVEDMFKNETCLQNNGSVRNEVEVTKNFFAIVGLIFFTRLF